MPDQLKRLNLMERFDLMGAEDHQSMLEAPTMPTAENGGQDVCKLSTQDKVAIVLDGGSSRHLADRYGVHHSRICDIRNEASSMLAAEWDKRRPGPKPKVAEVDPEEFFRKERELEQAKREVALLTMRKEWLELQLKIQAARDEEVEKGHCAVKRKKKRRKNG